MSFKKDDNSSMFISFLYISLLDKTKCKMIYMRKTKYL